MEDQLGFLKQILSTGLVAGILGFALSEWRDRRKKNSDMLALLKSFLAEISALWEQHKWSLFQDTGVKSFQEIPIEDGFAYYYPLTYDYFTVYHNNSDRLGSIRSDDLRALIIKTYNRAKGLVDTFQMNNEILKKLYELEHEYAVSQNEALQATISRYRQELKQYGTGLIDRNIELDGLVEQLIASINAEIRKYCC